MRNKKLAIAAITSLGLAFPASAAVIDLGFALDESGSVSNPNFNLSKQGLANALDQIPTSGANEYRISVIAFDGNARTIIPPTTVTAGNVAGLKTQINGIVNSRGLTDIAEAVDLLTANFVNAGLGAETYLNVATDGGSSSNALATAAENANNAGVDGLSFEAIGGGADTATLLRSCFGGGANSYADPGSGNTAAGCMLVGDANNLPDATQEGFVLTVGSFTDFEGAISSKVQSIVDDTGGGVGVVPLPASLPLLLSALGIGGFVARRKKKSA